MKHEFRNVGQQVSGDLFVGRERECAELLEQIRKGACCEVVGLRHIGKMSLLREAERRLLAEEAGRWLVLHSNLGVYVDEDDPEEPFFQDLATALDEELQAGQEEAGEGGTQHSSLYNSIPPRRNSFEFFKSFLLRLRRTAPQQHVLLFLDEFDACSQFARLGGFFQRVRVLIDDCGLICEIATSRTIFMLEQKSLAQSSSSSILSGIVTSFELRPFDRATFEKLCDQSVADVGESERKAYFAQAFGHPWLSGKLLYYHNQISREGANPDAEATIQRAQPYFEQYFAHLRDLFAEFPANKDCERAGIGNWFECLIWREKYKASIPEEILENFRRYGFWRQGDNLPGALHEFVTRDLLDPWKELKQIEVGLRRWIEKCLKGHYGDESEGWFMKMKLPAAGSEDSPWKEDEKEKNKSFQEIVHDEWAKRRKRYPEIRHLDCTYLDDLMKIILSHWAVHGKGWTGFGKAVDDKTRFQKMLLAAGAVRNPEAHFYDYPATIMAKFEEAARYLTGILEHVGKEGN